MKIKDNVDVLVVGAGPAGSIAARVLAENNVDVLVLDKKQEIGTPKRCAEGIHSNVLDTIGLKPDPRWVVNETLGAIIYSPSEKKVEINFKDVGIGGYILERKIFEKSLAIDAINAGARYAIKTMALDVIKENGKVTGVKAEHMGEEIKIRSKIVIAADGVDSKIAKSAGLNTTNRLEDYESGFQYEMAGLKNINFKDLHIFFGNEVAPLGYVWIFPKIKNTANVGIGILSSKSTPEKNAKYYLDKFIEDHPDIFEDASPIEINAGGVPISSSIDTFVTDGLMVVGDAAQIVNPLHGGGIRLAMNSAKIAAEVSVNALKEDDLSKSRLYEYEKIWRETDGVRMKKLLKVRVFLEKLNDEDFERLMDILGAKDIINLSNANYKFLFRLLLTKAPKLLPLAKKFLV